MSCVARLRPEILIRHVHERRYWPTSRCRESLDIVVNIELRSMDLRKKATLCTPDLRYVEERRLPLRARAPCDASVRRQSLLTNSQSTGTVERTHCVNEVGANVGSRAQTIAVAFIERSAVSNNSSSRPRSVQAKSILSVVRWLFKAFTSSALRDLVASSMDPLGDE